MRWLPAPIAVAKPPQRHACPPFLFDFTIMNFIMVLFSRFL
jgi:hypothetical protein